MRDDNADISILPFYLLCDVSYSMDDDGKIVMLNNLLPRLQAELVRNPVVGDMTRIGVIDFADHAEVVVPLTDLRHVEVLPTLKTRGGTAYGSALRELKNRIELDYKLLRADGFSVKRATAVMVSDGAPTDAEGTWRAAFDELTAYEPETKTGFRLFPNLIPVGIGNARRDVLSDLRFRKDGDAPMPALFMQDGGDPAKAIAELIPLLIRSIVNSSLAQGTGAAGDQGGAAKAMADTLGGASAHGFDVELD